MSVNVNKIYQEFQQSRDLLPDGSYQNLLAGVGGFSAINQQSKEQLIQGLMRFAKSEMENMSVNFLRFRSIVDPF